MKFSTITTSLLLTAAPLSLAAPALTARAIDKAPSVESFREAITAAKAIPADKTIFYTGGGCASRSCIAYKKAHSLIRIQDVSVLGMDDLGQYTEDAQQDAVDNWSKAFAQVSSGVAWVMFSSSDAIDESRKSVWNRKEFPALRKNDDVDEVIQIDATDVTKIQQIHPVEIRKYADRECAWHGTAPLCGDVECPDGMKKKAESRYGGDLNVCTTGKKVYCCKKD